MGPSIKHFKHLLGIYKNNPGICNYYWVNLILHFYETLLCKYYIIKAFYHKMIDTCSGEPLVFPCFFGGGRGRGACLHRMNDYKDRKNLEIVIRDTKGKKNINWLSILLINILYYNWDLLPCLGHTICLLNTYLKGSYYTKRKVLQNYYLKP